jgi:hypothetical protein
MEESHRTNAGMKPARPFPRPPGQADSDHVSPGIWLFLAAATVAGTFFWTFLYAGILSAMRRPMQGEGVLVPWRVCLFGYFATTVFVPYVVSLVLAPPWYVRVAVLVALTGLACLWYFGLELGCDELLAKAWRRGL